jgi:hypothetical protein
MVITIVFNFHLQFQNVIYPLFSVYKIIEGLVFKITVWQYQKMIVVAICTFRDIVSY